VDEFPSVMFFVSYEVPNAEECLAHFQVFYQLDVGGWSWWVFDMLEAEFECWFPMDRGSDVQQ
jgi:hypothetical protein